MTIEKAISLFDSQRRNDVTASLKIEWLSELDWKIYEELLKKRYDIQFNGYTSGTSTSTELLAPEAFSEIYPAYLIMKTDYMNAETGRYNNSASVFNRLYYELTSFVNREKPIKSNVKLKAGKIYV